MMIKCQRCGRMTQKNSHRQRYCPTCAIIATKEYNQAYQKELGKYAAYRSLPPVFNCAVCGKETKRTTVHQKYCSRDCAKKAERIRDKQRFAHKPKTPKEKKPAEAKPADKNKIPPNQRPVPESFCKPCVWFRDGSCSFYYATGQRRDVSNGINTCGSRKLFDQASEENAEFDMFLQSLA